MQRLLSPMHHTARLLPITALSAKQRHAMAALYLAHYNASSPALFQRDLSAKDEVIVLEHEGALAGFTALQTWPLRWRGQDMRVLYSGDTIVAPAHWGQQTLALAWLERVGLLLRQAPPGGLWWFLLVKGHRTYKYLSTFARAFHPHWAQAHPGWQALADHLAAQRFGLQYNPATGVVRFDERIVFLLDMEQIIGSMDPSINLANHAIHGATTGGEGYHVLIADDSPSIRNTIAA